MSLLGLHCRDQGVLLEQILQVARDFDVDPWAVSTSYPKKLLPRLSYTNRNLTAIQRLVLSGLDNPPPNARRMVSFDPFDLPIYTKFQEYDDLLDSIQFGEQESLFEIRTWRGWDFRRRSYTHLLTKHSELAAGELSDFPDRTLLANKKI
jgi:hypothetical protein